MAAARGVVARVSRASVQGAPAVVVSSRRVSGGTADVAETAARFNREPPVGATGKFATCRRRVRRLVSRRCSPPPNNRYAMADDDHSPVAASWWPGRLLDVGPRLLEFVCALDVDARRRDRRDIRWEPYADNSRGQKVRGWMRFAHTGELGGLVGEALAGLASARRRAPRLHRSRAGAETVRRLARPQPARATVAPSLAAPVNEA